MTTYGFSLLMRGKDATPTNFTKMAKTSEELGLDSLWCSSHIIMPPQVESGYVGIPGAKHPPHWSEQYWEPMTVLSYLAAQTSKLTLGTSVTVLPMHNPIEVAKQVAEVDQLTRGRFVFGVGVGWFSEEFGVLGQDFQTRGKRTDEALEMMQTLWTEEPASFNGEFFQFSDAHFAPKPVQQPHPPIWIGGKAGAALRRAARFGDAFHPVRPTYEKLIEDWAKVRELALGYGRNADSLELAVKVPIIFQNDAPGEGQYYTQGRPEDMVESLQRFMEIGASHFVLDLVPETMENAMETMQRFAEEVMPKVEN